jgi:hypothetical protein
MADRFIYTTVSISTPLVPGRPMTVVDASHAPASCYPSKDAITIADGACPTNIVAPTDDRCARLMHFFSASARRRLNLPILQGIQT